MVEVRDYRKKIDKHLAEYRLVKSFCELEAENLKKAEERGEHLREALATAQEIAQQIQQEAHRRIADVVTLSLKAVFDEPYTFKIHFEQKRGKTEAVLAFERDGLSVDPLTASGGGVVDVAAFALRLSCMLLSQPPLRRVLVMDEPFRFVSAEFQPRVRDLLQTLSKDMGCQFVIVTHQDVYKIGTIVQL